MNLLCQTFRQQQKTMWAFAQPWWRAYWKRECKAYEESPQFEYKALSYSIAFRYFTFTSEITCGIPAITLLGQKFDYENILARLNKLDKLGEESWAFVELLKPIIREFMTTFLYLCKINVSRLACTIWLSKMQVKVRGIRPNDTYVRATSKAGRNLPKALMWVLSYVI